MSIKKVKKTGEKDLLQDIGVDFKAVQERFSKEKDKYDSDQWQEIRENIAKITSQEDWNLHSGDPKKLSYPKMLRIAYALRIPIEYFLFGDMKMFDHYQSDIIQIPSITMTLDENEKFVYYKDNCEFYFKLECIKQITSKAEALLTILFSSDVMEPTISNKSRIIIDRSKTEIKDGLIFAFIYKNSKFIQIRRLFLKEDKIEVIADNKDYDSYLTDYFNIKIIGKVVFICNCMNSFIMEP